MVQSTDKLKREFAERRLSTRLDRVLIASYHSAKSLTESLAVLDYPSSHFSPDEKQAISYAHQQIARAFAELNKVVVDKGQDNPEVPNEQS